MQWELKPFILTKIQISVSCAMNCAGMRLITSSTDQEEEGAMGRSVEEIRNDITNGGTSLGIEFGSTRIKRTG